MVNRPLIAPKIALSETSCVAYEYDVDLKREDFFVMNFNTTSVDETLARACVDIIGRLLPQGYDVSADAPDDFDAAVAYFEKHGTVCVTDHFGPDVIMRTPDQQYAFAAWHDLCHVRLKAGFDREGERLVQTCQKATLFKWFLNIDGKGRNCSQHEFNRAAAVLHANNIGRLDYWHRYGEAPPNARIFSEGALAALELLEPRIIDPCRQHTTYTK